MQRSIWLLLPLAILLAAPMCSEPKKGGPPDSDTDEPGPFQEEKDPGKKPRVDTDTDTAAANQCSASFTVVGTDGVEYTVATRPHFAPSATTPTGTIASGGASALEVDVTADACGKLRISHLVSHLACSDYAGSGWANQILSEPWRFTVSVKNEPSIRAYSFLYDTDPSDGTEASLQIEFQPPIRLAAGETKTIVYTFDWSGASESSGDWVQMIQDPRAVWWGMDDPPSYPAESWLEGELPLEGEKLICQL